MKVLALIFGIATAFNLEGELNESPISLETAKRLVAQVNNYDDDMDSDLIAASMYDDLDPPKITQKEDFVNEDDPTQYQKYQEAFNKVVELTKQLVKLMITSENIQKVIDEVKTKD